MLVAIYRKILRRNKQGKAPRCDALLGALVRVTRLERAISASQMRRGTNSATPGYSLSCHDTTARGKNKVFSVCGHLCGQSRFCAVFSNRGKSRKRRRRKALRRFALPYPGYNHGTPKCGTVPTPPYPDRGGVRRPITDGVPLLYQIFSGLARGKSAVQSGLQSRHTVGSLPAHAQILTAHVAIGRQLAVDGSAQIQIPDDGGGA